METIAGETASASMNPFEHREPFEVACGKAWWCAEESVYDSFCLRKIRFPGGNHEYIGVVVMAGHLCRKRSSAERGAHPAGTVGTDDHAVAGAAGEHPESASGLHGAGDGFGKNRVVVARSEYFRANVNG